MRVGVLAAAGAALALTARNSNTDPGNDREAAWAPPEEPAPIEPVATALANASGALLKPETMTDAEVASLGGRAGRCAVKLTEVAFPSFLYQPGGTGYIRLNGKLIPLPMVGPDRFADGGLQVSLQPLDDRGDAGLQSMNMIVVLPDADDELGYRGYVQCFRAGQQ